MPFSLPDGWTSKRMKLFILERFSVMPNQAASRSNMVGRSRTDIGDLERTAQLTFTDDQRETAYRLINQLYDAGFLSRRHQEIGGGNDWVELNDAGRRALARGHLDDLDQALEEIQPDLVDRRDGMWFAFHSEGPDSLPQATASARELLNQVLHALAPDDRVVSMPGFVPDPSSARRGITRAHRVRLILSEGGVGAGEEDLIEGTCRQISGLYGRLSSGTHTRTALEAARVLDILRLTEFVLKQLLRIA